MNDARTYIVGGGMAAVGLLVFLFYQSLLVPGMIAMFFAYVLIPSMNLVERKWRVPRNAAALLLIVLVIAILGGAIAGLVPVIQKEIYAIAGLLPKARDHVVAIWVPWLQGFLVQYGLLTAAEFAEWVREFGLTSQLGDPGETLQQIMNQTSGLLGGVVNIALIPVFCFFMMRDYERVSRGLLSLIPLDVKPTIVRFGVEVDVTLRQVINRQLAVAAILGILYMAGLSMVGLRFSLAIGAIAGICRVVPYLDVLVGASLAFVAIVTDPEVLSFGRMAGVVVVFAVVQSIDGMIITPRIIGGKVGLHPGIVIASIFAFADWMGFGGVLIAIPVVAIVKILLQGIITTYRSSEFFDFKGQVDSDDAIDG